VNTGPGPEATGSQPAKTRRDTVRRTLGAAVSGALVLLSLWHLFHAVQSWRDWRAWRVADPSAADFYMTSLQVESAFTAFSLVAAFLAWKLLGSSGS